MNPFRACVGVCGGRRRPRRRDNSPSRQILPSKRYFKGLSGNSTYSPREYPPLVRGGDREAQTPRASLFLPYTLNSSAIRSAMGAAMRHFSEPALIRKPVSKTFRCIAPPVSMGDEKKLIAGNARKRLRKFRHNR